ncbi:MAG: hypothetical protein JXA21_06020 [Anaerolineae bacterium]|nr:hypothetical protein [Anaerolineae bacterium]
MTHKHILSCLVMCIALTALALAAPQAAFACGGGVICVDADATGAATGLSWTDAYTNVQDALAVANYGDEIWVAEGVYYPDEGMGQTDNAMTATFALKPGVALYGGFAGTEATLGMRNPAVYLTVLSGDIDGNDSTDSYGIVTSTEALAGRNAYHVVMSENMTETARLDGFTITAGNADGGVFDGTGGGMFIGLGGPTLSDLTFIGNYAGSGGGMHSIYSNPTLLNVLFRHNRAESEGGGMTNTQGDPILTGVIFNGNRAPQGGGMLNNGGNPVLTDVTFTDNQGDYLGGGMATGNGNPVLTRVAFFGNHADLWDGGGLYNMEGNPVLTDVVFSGNWTPSTGGGMYNYGSPQLTNVLFSGNRAAILGGGMSNVYTTSNPSLTNVTFSGNWAGEYGGGLVNAGKPTLTNCILWGNYAMTGTDIYNETNEPIVTYSDIQWPGGVYTGTGNIALDPQFVAPITATAAPTTTGNYRLRPDSPAIDAGNSLSATVAADLDGNPRIANEAVDMGAYETFVRAIFLPLVLRN